MSSPDDAAPARGTKHVVDTVALVKLLRSTADRLESKGQGGLTGVVLVAEAVKGVFVEDAPLTAAWTSMQGGEGLFEGLLGAADDVSLLRMTKKKALQ